MKKLLAILTVAALSTACADATNSKDGVPPDEMNEATDDPNGPTGDESDQTESDEGGPDDEVDANLVLSQDLRITPTQLDFEMPEPGAWRLLTISLVNTGDETLVVESARVEPDEGALSDGPEIVDIIDRIEIVPGAFRELQVRYTGRGGSRESGVIIFELENGEAGILPYQVAPPETKFSCFPQTIRFLYDPSLVEWPRRNFTVFNDSDQALEVHEVELTGEDFEIEYDGPDNGNLDRYGMPRHFEPQRGYEFSIVWRAEWPSEGFVSIEAGQYECSAGISATRE